MHKRAYEVKEYGASSKDAQMMIIPDAFARLGGWFCSPPIKAQSVAAAGAPGA